MSFPSIGSGLFPASWSLEGDSASGERPAITSGVPAGSPMSDSRPQSTKSVSELSFVKSVSGNSSEIWPVKADHGGDCLRPLLAQSQEGRRDKPGEKPVVLSHVLDCESGTTDYGPDLKNLASAALTWIGWHKMAPRKQRVHD